MRTDHALESGAEISPYYDSMIAKVIAHGATRDEARERLARALDDTVALGVATNKSLLAAALRDEEFARGPTTAFLDRFTVAPAQPDAATLAIAAALFAATAGFGEWNSWSNNPARMMRAKFAGRRSPSTIWVTPTSAEVDETPVVLRILSLDPPHARIAIDGAEEIVFLIEGETIHLAHGGQSHSLENTVHAPPARRAAGPARRPPRRPDERPGGRRQRAGRRHRRGRPRPRRARSHEDGACAERAGAARVKAVHVAAGAQVSPGQLLVELEPS